MRERAEATMEIILWRDLGMRMRREGGGERGVRGERGEGRWREREEEME